MTIPAPLPHLFAAGALLGLAALPAQESPLSTTALAADATRLPFDRVLHAAADPDTGTLWAGGRDWKASFGRSGFTFVPFLGADAERNHPVAFLVAAVAVGGRPVPIDGNASPSRDGDRVTFDRGALREIYDLTAAHVAQSFVLDTAPAGDVDIELRVTTDLVASTARSGLQWVNDRGGVGYGDAFLVRDGERHAITTSWRGDTLRLHVPSAMRGSGPVVIDPIVSTALTGFMPGAQGAPRPCRAPDVAFDVGGNVFCVVWESLFSASDTDVFSEMFDGDGHRILGSGSALDFSSLVYSQPAIGDCNATDTFLVAMTKVDPFAHQGRAMIVGRTRVASPTTSWSPEFLVSDPQFSGAGQHAGADVGGDSGGAGGTLGFAIVWTYSSATSNSAVHSRFYTGTGTASGPDAQLLGGPRPLFAPRISPTDGRGIVANPGWLVVMSQLSPNDQDVLYCHLTTSGQTTGFGSVDNDFGDDRYPEVSSPMTSPNGNATWYLVTYEQQLPAAARAVIFEPGAPTVKAPTDLTGTFGFGAFWVRAECDGVRFAVTATDNAAGTSIGIGTLAFDGQSLTVHENLRSLSGMPSYPRLTSKYASGGPSTQFAVTYLDSAISTPTPALTLYDGHQPGTQIAQHALACGGLQLQWSGLPLLAGLMQFTLSNLGGDFASIGFGTPAPAPIPLCPACSLGLRPDMPISLTFGTAMALPIPRHVALVGSTFGIQGVAIGQGSCLGALRFSDMIEITVR